jgi:hypothetical protein
MEGSRRMVLLYLALGLFVFGLLIWLTSAVDQI